MNQAQNGASRVLAHDVAHQHSVEEISAEELGAIGGAGCTGTTSVTATHGGGKPDDISASADLNCSL